MHLLEVSLPDFLDAAGTEHLSVVVRLWADSANTHLVLFTDDEVTSIAVLPVGPELEYRTLEQAAALTFDGLHARLFMRSRTGDLLQHETDLAKHEAAMRSREAYVADCENRLASLSAALSEREAELEHRESQLLERELKLGRHSREGHRDEPFAVAPPPGRQF